MTESSHFAEQKMSAAIDYLRDELKGVRTNRANPSLVDSVPVEVYGATCKLKDIAQINVGEARQLLITPFDPQNAAAIGKAITRANLNLNPIVEPAAVRINIPPMDENARREMARLCRNKGEEAKISIRNARRDALEISKQSKQKGQLPEDECKREEKKVQDLTNKFCKRADELCQEREKEVLVV